jgi:hypothetical protein
MLPERQDKNTKMSYTKLLYHIVFRTKNSKSTISEQHEGYENKTLTVLGNKRIIS